MWLQIEVPKYKVLKRVILTSQPLPHHNILFAIFLIKEHYDLQFTYKMSIMIGHSFQLYFE